MTPSQLSRTDVAEKVVSGLAGLIPVTRTALKLDLPCAMRHRAVFLFLEAICTTPGEDFELEAELEWRKNGVGIHTMPASIAENVNSATFLQTSRATAFSNVTAGTAEGWLVKLGLPLTNGSTEAAVTPQKLIVEADEVWLNLLGSRQSASSFSGWRAWLAVRSSEVAL